MDYNYAIKLFGLDNSFTLEELKRKYKELLKKYHPDNNSSKDASQKTNEVINAYNLLKKYVTYNEDNDNMKSDDNIKFEKSKDFLKEIIINKYFKEIEIEPNQLYTYYLYEQKKLVYDALLAISKAKSNSELLKIAEELKKNVKTNINNMIINLIKNFNIQNMDIIKTIKNLSNQCDNILDAYCEYLKILNELNTKLDSKLDLKIQSFKNLDFYDKLESKILEIKKHALNLNNIFFINQTDLLVEEFEKKVNELFKTYELKLKKDRTKIKEIIEKLKKYQDSIAYFKIKDDKLKDKCTELLSLTGEDNFDIKYKEVNDELDELIKEMKKNKIKQNNIFNKLVKEYYSKVESLNLIGDLTQIKNETEKLNKIIKIFENLDTLNLQAINLLEQLENASDSEIDKTLNMILYGSIIEYDDIFFDATTCEVVIVEDIDESNIFYRLIDESSIKAIDFSNFKDKFLSLKNLINISNFVGKQIFLEDERFQSINGDIVLFDNFFYKLVVSNDFKSFTIINRLYGSYKIGSEVVIEEISKDEIFNMISNIAKNAEYKQDSDSNIKTKAKKI